MRLRLWCGVVLLCITVLSWSASAALPDAAWKTNMVLGQRGPFPFAGIYEYNNLTISDNVVITTNGISQLVIKVKGQLKIGKNVVIRVRNGYYPQAPAYAISSVTASNLNSLGMSAGGFRVYENMFGRGGRGGTGGFGGYGGGNMTYLGYGEWYNSGGIGGSGGGGGGGGFGGGLGGDGGDGGAGTHQMLNGQISNGFEGYRGYDNGSQGGLAVGGQSGQGGGATAIGTTGSIGAANSNGGGGGGGNGGEGGAGMIGSLGDGNGGGGGGGGGYGGGILTIVADSMVYDSNFPPRFYPLGQLGGYGGYPNGWYGQNGQGGMLIIQCPDYQPSSQHWSLNNLIYGNNSIPEANGGHGCITGTPQKVFVNGKDVTQLQSPTTRSPYDVSGSYAGTYSVGGGTASVTLQLVQVGNRIQGRWDWSNRLRQFMGTIEGINVNGNLTFTVGLHIWAMEIRCTFHNGTLTGTIAFKTGETGAFTATRQ